jgi:hypothetical protein
MLLNAVQKDCLPLRERPLFSMEKKPGGLPDDLGNNDLPSAIDVGL